MGPGRPLFFVLVLKITKGKGESIVKRFIRASEAKSHGLPVSSATLYKWNHLGKYPQLFRRLGGMLLVDLRTGKLGPKKTQKEREVLHPS